MPRVEVRFPDPYTAARRFTIQVSFLHYYCPLVCNRQIHEDLGFPLFPDHPRALTGKFNSKLADMGNRLLRQLGRYAGRGLTPSPNAKSKGGRGQQAS